MEKRRRELEEAEVRRLAQEKERLEAEKWIEEQRGAERAAEQRRAALVALLPPEAGLSRVPLGQPERSTRGVDHELGIVIPEKNCA